MKLIYGLTNRGVGRPEAGQRPSAGYIHMKLMPATGYTFLNVIWMIEDETNVIWMIEDETINRQL